MTVKKTKSRCPLPQRRGVPIIGELCQQGLPGIARAIFVPHDDDRSTIGTSSPARSSRGRGASRRSRCVARRFWGCHSCRGCSVRRRTSPPRSLGWDDVREIPLREIICRVQTTCLANSEHRPAKAGQRWFSRRTTPLAMSCTTCTITIRMMIVTTR